ncbi:hypothetical protein U0070_011014 [Myodes glareolus]|uniref:Rho-GAP domain-containing protein n=1 Tax=Myodes glareolus TaxID=447135 RepID=A0AAW0IHW5_MYOGA
MVTEAPSRNKWKKSDIKKEDYALTKFIVQKTRFGLTETGDLSAEDMKKIRHLSLIELTAFFDAFGIPLKRNKTERGKGRDSGIFGVPLTVLLDNDRKKDPEVKVPLVLQKFFQKVEESGLESEGIFRLSGCTAKVKKQKCGQQKDYDKNKMVVLSELNKAFIMWGLWFPAKTTKHSLCHGSGYRGPGVRHPRGLIISLALQQYREELDARFNADKFKWDKMCHREAAVMLKAFFRELPTSLFPVEYIPAFITLMERGPHIKVQFQALHLMVMALPDANRDTAQALMTFFNKVIANESKNRMSLWNISTVMAPNLFFSRSKHSDYEELLLANTAAHIIRLMLRYQKILWKSSPFLLQVPSFLITQVRRMNEATMLLKKQLPSVKKLLRRKTLERESDVPEGVIRVHAPLLSKVSMAIQLNSQTKAKDILAKFQYENSHGSSECIKMQNQRLYEVGGNIEWVIKPSPSL